MINMAAAVELDGTKSIRPVNDGLRLVIKYEKQLYEAVIDGLRGIGFVEIVGYDNVDVNSVNTRKMATIAISVLEEELVRSLWGRVKKRKRNPWGIMNDIDGRLEESPEIIGTRAAMSTDSLVYHRILYGTEFNGHYHGTEGCPFKIDVVIIERQSQTISQNPQQPFPLYHA